MEHQRSSYRPRHRRADKVGPTPWRSAGGRGAERERAGFSTRSVLTLVVLAAVAVGAWIPWYLGRAGADTLETAGVASRVTILAGTKRLATVSSRANGAFTYAVPKKSKATTFRARVVVAGRDAPAVCGQFGSLGVPCVNATVSGFTATSRAIRLR